MLLFTGIRLGGQADTIVRLQFSIKYLLLPGCDPSSPQGPFGQQRHQPGRIPVQADLQCLQDLEQAVVHHPEWSASVPQALQGRAAHNHGRRLAAVHRETRTGF